MRSESGTGIPLKERLRHAPCGARFQRRPPIEISCFDSDSYRIATLNNCSVLCFDQFLVFLLVAAHPTAGRGALARLRYCIQHGAQLLGMAERLVRVFRTVRVVQGEHLRPTYREGGKGSKEKLREAAS